MIEPDTSRMRREIAEIPAVVERELADAAAIAAVAAAIRARRPGWIMIAARGTSDHAAVYAQYLVETRLGVPTGLAKPSVTTVYGARLAWNAGLVLAISQSGRSPDVVAVIAAAREAGATTLALTNDPASPLADAAELTLDLRAGPELAVPATKTYVAELAVVAALVAELADDDALRAELKRLPDALRGAMAASERWLAADGGAFVGDLVTADRALLVSRGFNLATALELALKLKETCGIFAEAYSTADFAHGPLVLAGAGVPTLAIRPDGAMAADVDAMTAAVEARGGRTAVIGGADLVGASGALALRHGLSEALTPLVFVVPGQLLVEAAAIRRGLSPDAPPGLGKVTLTR